MITRQSVPLPAPPAGKLIRLWRFFPVSALVLTLVLCGCASESPWTKQAFAITAPSANAGPVAHTNSLSLRRVTVSPLYGGKPLVYRTGDHSYERDPYAEFLVPPDQMMAECLRLGLRDGRAFATVLEPDSGLKSSCVMEVSVTQLYGDFRQADKPFAVLQIRFVLYVTTPAEEDRMIWQGDLSKRLPLAHRTAAALVAGWNAGLQAIMDEVNSELRQTAIPGVSPLKTRSGKGD